MTTILRFVLVSIFLTLAVRVSAAATLLNIVDEQCPVVVSVQDMPALIKNWNQSPWAKTWNDEQMKKFLGPFRSHLKVDRWDEECKAETGYGLSELLGMAQGQVLLALTSMDLPFEEEEADPSKFPVFLAIELGSNASKVTKIIADNDEKEHATVKIEDFSGVPIHIYQKVAEKNGEEFAWAMVEGVWILSPSKLTIQKAIDSVQKGRTQTPLGESERYLKIKKQSPDANLMVLVNMQALYPAIKTLAEKRQAQSGSAAAGMQPAAVLEAFGLDTLHDVYLTVDMGESATNLAAGVTYSELRGFFKIIAYRDGPVAQPAFVSDKWITVATMAFSLQSAYAGVRDFLSALNPPAGGAMQMQIKNLNQQLGVDLERDLIGSIGDKIILSSAMRPGANPDAPTPLNELDQLYAFSMLNAPAFNKAVEALKGMMGPGAEKLFTKREYLGQAIYTFAKTDQTPGLGGFSYAVTPQYLFLSIGSPAALETAIQGLDGKQRTIWEKPDVKAALSEIPSGACAFQYQNTQAMVGSVIEMLVHLAPMLGGPGRPPADQGESEGEKAENAPAETTGMVDVSAKPDAAVIAKYWSYSTGYVERDSNGLYLHSKIHHVK